MGMGDSYLSVICLKFVEIRHRIGVELRGKEQSAISPIGLALETLITINCFHLMWRVGKSTWYFCLKERCSRDTPC